MQALAASRTLICPTQREEIGQYYLPIQYPVIHFRLCPSDTVLVLPNGCLHQGTSCGSCSRKMYTGIGETKARSRIYSSVKVKFTRATGWILIIIIVLYRESSILRQTASTESAVTVIYYMWKTEATPAIHRLSTLAYKHKRRTERFTDFVFNLSVWVKKTIRLRHRKPLYLSYSFKILT